jgi:hypothetical protein
MKRLFALSLVLLLTLTLVSPAFAQDEGPLTGSFSTAAAPSINSLQIFTDAALTTPATSLTPMQYYWIKASITDNDGIGNLSNVLIGTVL